MELTHRDTLALYEHFLGQNYAPEQLVIVKQVVDYLDTLIEEEAPEDDDGLTDSQRALIERGCGVEGGCE